MTLIVKSVSVLVCEWVGDLSEEDGRVPLRATNPVVRSGESTDVLEVSGKPTEKAPT